GAQNAVPPRISERAGRMVAKAGSSVTLPCVAQGHPPPHYTWYSSDGPLSIGSGRLWLVGGSLVINSLSAPDAREYICVANNTAGEARYSAHLQITTPLTVQVHPQTIQVDLGGHLELQCHITGQPVDSVTWYKDGHLLRAHGRIRIRPRESLHISAVEADDAGVYQCAASSKNDYAHDHTYVSLGAAAPQLVYRFIEQTLQPGPAVSLKCISQGTPTPQITWKLDGFPLPTSHRYLMGQYVSAHGNVVSHVNISSAQVKDGGIYTCTAQNTAGTTTHTARLNIYGAPHVRPMGQVSAVAGESYIVTCPVAGYPIDEIIWMKDGVQLPVSHRQHVFDNGTLVMDQVTRGMDDGRYSCTAQTNKGQHHSQYLTLTVMVPPRLVPVTFLGSPRAGMRTQAVCLVQEGDQPLTITWFKEGKPLDQELNVMISKGIDGYSSTLVIPSAQGHHSGNYSCVASNQARTITSSTILRVS
ncbi:unnamed protein product, partial [Meganyctiphanes norvegica]